MFQSSNATSAIAEYTDLVRSTTSDPKTTIDRDAIVRKLSSEHDWTERGASVLVSLALDYGAFMLKNAHALAIALDKEDGDLGF